MKKGFTLIELMIVGAIIAILIALIIPAFKQSTPNGVTSVGVDSQISPPSTDVNKRLKLIGETDKTMVYEFVSDDNRKCIMVESKYVDEETVINCN